MRLLRRELLGLPLGLAGAACADRPEDELLHASFDATRELLTDVNAAFSRSRGAALEVAGIRQAHGGSAKQARSVLEGLPADVVSLALAYDVDALAGAGRVDARWRARLPDGASPFSSTIVLLVRAGNPLGIQDFSDLGRRGLSVITPNPRSSGGARWNHLAVWGSEKRRTGSDERADELVAALYRNVPVFASGARGAMNAFANNGLGDVLLAWESEARLALSRLGDRRVSVVVPASSISAEIAATVVDRVVDRRGSRERAQAYLEWLWEPEAQRIVAERHFRPRTAEGRASCSLPDLDLFTIDEIAGGWTAAHQRHFAEGGLFERIEESVR